MKTTSSQRYKKWHLRHPWFRLWNNARMRCEDPNHRSYPRYGGMGVKFELIQHDCELIFARDGGHFMKCPSLDREDSTKGYTADNCRVIEKAINERIPHEKVLEEAVWQD